jgi:hypothetical protein
MLSFPLLSLREKHRFQNKVLKRTFRPKKDDVTGERRKLHNEELQNFYSLHNMLDWDMQMYEENKDVIEKLDWKTPAELTTLRPKHRW